VDSSVLEIPFQEKISTKEKKIKNRSKYALNKHNLTQFQNNNLGKSSEHDFINNCTVTNLKELLY
jgi:hypothetical protein